MKRRFYTGLAARPIVSSWVAGICLATWSLVASNAVTAIKESQRSAGRDRRSEALLEKIDDLALRAEKSDQRLVKRFNRVEDRIDQVADEVTRARISGKQSVPRRNTAEAWQSYAVGSVAYNINGELRFDIDSERRPNGSIIFVPDYERLRNWVVRFGKHTGVKAAHFVLYVDDTAGSLSPAGVEPQVARHIVAFRAVKKLATAMGVELALENVHFYLRPRSLAKPVKSFFVGVETVGSKNVPFVQYYEDNAQMFDVPRTMLDDEVHIYYSPEKVYEYRHLAEVLIAGQAQYSISDMESKYGHFLPDVDADSSSLSKALNIKNNAVDEDESQKDYDIVCNSYDAHFAIRRR